MHVLDAFWRSFKGQALTTKARDILQAAAMVHSKREDVNESEKPKLKMAAISSTCYNYFVQQ